jgi:signal transduction histidine kinase
MTIAAFAAGAVLFATGYSIAAGSYRWIAAAHFVRHHVPRLAGARDGVFRAAAGGALIGLGLAATHFTGMSALVIAGTVASDALLSLAAVLVGVVLSSAAMAVHRQQGPGTGPWAGTLLMVLAVSGLHFTAMSGLTVAPDARSDVHPSVVDNIVLAVALSAATAFVLGAGLVAMVIERLKAEVADHIAKLEEAHDEVSMLNIELANNMWKLELAQEEIVKKGRLAQLGQLTATVAHEIRNPLGAVKTAAYVLERMVKDKGLGVETQLVRINNGISRCDAIISELLDFARSKALALKSVAVAEWIEKALDEERRGLAPQVTLTFHNELGSGLVARFDADRMRRVLINLVSNASEAMVGKGREQPPVVTEKPRIDVTARLAGDRIEIEVRDNGPGISEENMKRILEPLFTTKSFGVGLGLPAVHKILEQHGGDLRIASVPGEGAAFTAWFPLEVPQHDQRAAEQKAA